MQEPFQRHGQPRSISRSRRQEINQCLVAFDLLRPGRFTRRLSITDLDSTYGRRLRSALAALGPVFTCFGVYLSSRVDMWPLDVCLELATLPDQAPPMPVPTLHEIFMGAFDRPLEDVYQLFDPIPFESRLQFQSHYALLPDGQSVTVKIVAPQLAKAFEIDAEHLDILKPILAVQAHQALLFDDAVEDFRRTFEWHLNLRHAASAFESLEQDAADFEWLSVPRIYPDLCSPTVLTLEHLTGTRLDTILASFQSDAHPGRRASSLQHSVGLTPHRVARLLCLVWLRQALLGQLFPAAFSPQDVMLLPNKQLAFTGGTMMALAADTKRNLWSYMIATTNEQPDTACVALLQEIRDVHQSVDEDELRYRFREVVPFRDSQWRSYGVSNSLVEYLFVHWKLFSERGLRLHPGLISFYRGLLHTSEAARQIPAYGDPFLDGLKDVRTAVTINQFQDMLAMDQLGEQVEKYITLLIELPAKLDRALSYAAENAVLQQPPRTPSGRQRNRSQPSAVFIALLLLIAAVVLLSRYLTAQGIGGTWLDTVTVIMFIALGGLMLRASSQNRP